MGQKHLKKKRSKGFIKIWCLVLFLALSIIGVGYGGCWGECKIMGTVFAGNIDPVFVEDIKVDADGEEQVTAFLDKKNIMQISIKNAHVGDVYHIQYKVANEGTIPVKVKTITSDSDSEIHLKLKNPEGIIEGYGDRESGAITIEVGEVEPDSTYQCMVSFVISQWNAID